jgi:hypothetical protein
MSTLVSDELFGKHGTGRDRLGDVVSSSDVFTREYGSEFTEWELELHRDFRVHERGDKYVHRGFVHYTRYTDLILLTPSPWLVQGVFIHLSPDQESLEEGAYVEVSGKSIALPRVLRSRNQSVQAFTGDNVQELKIDLIESIRPPLSLKDISEMLFEHVGMAEASKRVFARLFVSSPPFRESVGGLTAGIQAIASKAQVRRLLSFTRKVIPPTLRGTTSTHREVRGVRVSTPRTWRLDAGTISPTKLRKLCIERQDPRGFREVSVGTLTQEKTAVLPDVPLALTSEDFWIETRNPKGLRLPILKSVITFQMMSPKISLRSVDAATKYVLERMEKLRESFGLDQSAFARGHLLDGDALGRPLSTVRLARSTARAAWENKVKAADLKQSWNRILEPALKEFLELVELESEAKKDWGEKARLEKFNTRVHRAIRRLDSGKTGSLGPSLEEIAEEAGVEIHVASENLERMKRSGVVYEPRSGHYRLV